MYGTRSFLKSLCNHLIRFGEIRLVGLGVALRIRKFPVYTPMGVLMDLSTKPCYEVRRDLRVKKRQQLEWLRDRLQIPFLILSEFNRIN